ncbi:hypothetical protein ACOL3B_10350 [Aliarcobacter butzleri]
MKKVFNYLIYLLISIIILIFLIPKESFYNLFEKELEKYNIVISNEIREEKLDFTILNAEIFYQGIKVAKIDRLNFKSLLFYSKLNVENIYLEDKLKDFIPNYIEKISLKYNISNFNKIFIEANGRFGHLNGEFNLFNKVIQIEMTPSNEMKNLNLIKYFKYENERYKYEYKF